MWALDDIADVERFEFDVLVAVPAAAFDELAHETWQESSFCSRGKKGMGLDPELILEMLRRLPLDEQAAMLDALLSGIAVIIEERGRFFSEQSSPSESGSESSEKPVTLWWN
jgi:hypothetical protein